jgi:hypothetical protein
LVCDTPGTKKLKELSLAIDTTEALVVGCSHPEIERIAEAAAAINPKAPERASVVLQFVPTKQRPIPFHGVSAETPAIEGH